jgi:hypothetical protein
VGLGVVDPLGGSPSAKWEIRIRLVDSTRLQNLALSLLAGGRVVASDDYVHIAWLGSSSRRSVLRIRDSDSSAKYLLEVSVEALLEEELNEITADSAGVPNPIPEAWKTINSDISQTWELFNCRVTAVTIIRA